jgi:hypothetical protein
MSTSDFSPGHRALPRNLANPKESQPAQITQLLFQSGSKRFASAVRLHLTYSYFISRSALRARQFEGRHSLSCTAQPCSRGRAAKASPVFEKYGDFVNTLSLRSAVIRKMAIIRALPSEIMHALLGVRSLGYVKVRCGRSRISSILSFLNL